MAKYHYVLGGHNDPQGLPSPKEYENFEEAYQAMADEMGRYDGGALWHRLEVDENDDGNWRRIPKKHDLVAVPGHSGTMVVVGVDEKVRTVDVKAKGAAGEVGPTEPGVPWTLLTFL